MVVVELIRLVIVLSLTAAGYRIGQQPALGVAVAQGNPDLVPLVGAVMGAAVGYVGGGLAGRLLLRGIGSVEQRVDRVGGADVVTGLLGLLFGGVAASVVAVLVFVLVPFPLVRYPAIAIAFLTLGYAGFRIAIRKRYDVLHMMGLASNRPFTAPSTAAGPKVLDTSALIDGRIVDVVRAGFLSGRLILPTFVLGELTGIADSGDPVRRARGRRGLEVLDVLRSHPGVELEVSDDTVPDVLEVDAKLVSLARRLGGALVTTDYNVHRAAELHGIVTLNLNNLAAALKPAVLPGEALTVSIVKAGNHAGQGVGYLDDGTMVVVEGGRDAIGSVVEATVTSVMQTSVGRMIFSTTGAAARRSRPGSSR